jgi:hypothetical protein
VYAELRMNWNFSRFTSKTPKLLTFNFDFDFSMKIFIVVLNFGGSFSHREWNKLLESCSEARVKLLAKKQGSRIWRVVGTMKNRSHQNRVGSVI